MNNIFENWNNFLTEDVYSEELYAFIQFSYELDQLRDERLIPLSGKKKRLYDFLENNDFIMLGSGLTRTGYATPSGEVIKIVKTVGNQDIEEMKKEISIFNRHDLDAFPRIEAYDDKDYLWFVVEHVTQIGKKNTGEKYRKLFPKLLEFVEGYIPKKKAEFNLKIKQKDSWDYVYDLISLLKYKYFLKHDKDFMMKHDENYGNHVVQRLIDMPSRKIEDNPDLGSFHKEVMDFVFDYFKNPDPNFAKLVRAVTDAKVNPMDLHYNNLGYNEDWEIKIMDAGL